MRSGVYAPIVEEPGRDSIVVVDWHVRRCRRGRDFGKGVRFDRNVAGSVYEHEGQAGGEVKARHDELDQFGDVEETVADVP